MSHGKTQHSELNGNKHSPLEFLVNTILTFQCRLENLKFATLRLPL
jgi:endonuclease III